MCCSGKVLLWEAATNNLLAIVSWLGWRLHKQHAYVVLVRLFTSTIARCSNNHVTILINDSPEAFWAMGKREKSLNSWQSKEQCSYLRWQRATTRAAAFNGAYAARISDPATQACKKGQRWHPWQYLGGEGDLSAEVRALMAAAAASRNGWTSWWICDLCGYYR